jgi:hypothetical protein
MKNQEEKVEEKVSTPVSKENPVEDKSEAKVEPKSEPKSEDSQISEVEKLRKDLLAQADAQSKLQKKLNESEKVIDAFKTAIGGEEADTDVVTVEAVKTQLDSLRQEIAKKDAELAKNNFIDGLEEPEPVKRYLKSKIQTPDGDLEEVVSKELEAVKELISSATPKATDNRPKGVGISGGDTSNMQYVLDHPELFKK